MGWRSGRVEPWDIGTKKRVSEFRPGVGWPRVLKFDAQGNQLLVIGSGGKFVWLELPEGKKLRGFAIPLGKYKYDVQEIVLDKGDKWLAYADEESSKVLDLTVNPPKMILDLKDACNLTLSQDGSELWTVNRSELRGFRTATWELVGQYPLKRPPINTSPALVRSGVTPDGRLTLAVPSDPGLVLYREPDMAGEFVTNKPSSAVAFSRPTNTYIDLATDITFLGADGRILCKKSYAGRVSHAVSDDGQWFALSQFDRVDLWRMHDLVYSCTPAP